MDWLDLLLYLGGLVLILLVLAGLLYLAFHCTNSPDDGSVSNINNQDNKINVERSGKTERAKRTAAPQVHATPLLTSNGSRMVSSLRHSPKDTDVVLISASSAIPLAQIGGKNSDIIVDVMQQMHLDDTEVAKETRECIVCKRRNEISWKQVSCYAQTTIGVLVLKRDLIEQQQPTITPTSDQSTNSLLEDRKKSSRTLSTLNFAPTPDSRIAIVNKTRPRSAGKSAQEAQSQCPNQRATLAADNNNKTNSPQAQPSSATKKDSSSSSRT